MANMDETGRSFGTEEVLNAAGAPIAEEAEGAAQATGREHFGSSSSVSVAPIANQGVESQQVKSGQTEKGKAAATDSENNILPVCTRVTCSEVQPGAEGVCHRTAVVVTSRNTKDGVEYYVRYDDHDNLFNEWLLCTFVEKFSDEGISGIVQSPVSTPITPADHLGTDTTGTPNSRRSTRSSLNPLPDETTKTTKKSSQKEYEEESKPKNFKDVWLGKHVIDTWYFSPYPEEYHHRIYICEFCLKYMRKKRSLDRHKAKCTPKHPPGYEIYETTAPIAEQVREFEGIPTSGVENISSERLQHLSVYKVDGSSNSKLYCQNLCLLAGLFLGDKTLYYNIDSFLLYILTENDASGKHLVAYFSKLNARSEATEQYEDQMSPTLSFLKILGIKSGAYELSKIEGKAGTPERPLSALGKASIHRYWERVLVETIQDHRHATFQELTELTSIRLEDVIFTLTKLKLTKYMKTSYEPNFPKTKRAFDVLLKKIKPLPDWLKFDIDQTRRPSAV